MKDLVRLIMWFKDRCVIKVVDWWGGYRESHLCINESLEFSYGPCDQN